jgi:hypothetical protein
MINLSVGLKFDQKIPKMQPFLDAPLIYKKMLKSLKYGYIHQR